MQFGGEQKLNFGEVDRRYAELRRQYDSNVLSAADFDAQLQKMVIQDERGTWWGKERDTGRWMHYDGSTWVFNTDADDIRPDPPPPSGPPWLVLGWVCAVVSLFFLAIITGPIGIYFGHRARQAGRQTGGKAVIVVNGVLTAFGVIGILLLLL